DVAGADHIGAAHQGKGDGGPGRRVRPVFGREHVLLDAAGQAVVDPHGQLQTHEFRLPEDLPQSAVLAHVAVERGQGPTEPILDGPGRLSAAESTASSPWPRRSAKWRNTS